MALLTTQLITTVGLNPAYVAADTAGDTFDNRAGYPVFAIVNSGAGVMTVTFVAKQECNLGVLHNIVGAIPADSMPHFYGPFEVRIFNNQQGIVDVTYSDVTDVTVAVLKVET